MRRNTNAIKTDGTQKTSSVIRMCTIVLQVDYDILMTTLMGI